MGDYAVSSDVTAVATDLNAFKTEADSKYQAMGDYAVSSDIEAMGFAKASELDVFATTSDVEDTYATKNSLSLLESEVDTINTSLSTYLTKISAANTYALASYVGNQDLSSINPTNSRHDIATILLDIHSSLSNYAPLTNNKVSTSNLPDLSSTYIPVLSSNLFQAAGSYALQEDLTSTISSLSNYATKTDVSGSYAQASSLDALETAISDEGGIAYYCNKSGENYISVSAITSTFTDVKGHLSAIKACANHMKSHVNDEGGISITPTGDINDCSEYTFADAFVYCLGAISEKL